MSDRERVGKMTKGLEGKPDTTFVILDDDFMALATGKANPQNLVMTVINESSFVSLGQDEDQG